MAAQHDFPVIDADSHIVLPDSDEWWRGRIPRQYEDWMPRYQDDVLFAEGRVIEGPSPTFHGKPTQAAWFGSTQGATYTPGSWLYDDPATVEVLGALKRGGLDPQDRLKAMDREGISQAYIFPSKVLGLLPALRSAAFAYEIAKAYNDWAMAYCSAEPGRLLPVAVLPQHDVTLAVAEARRVRDAGIRTVILRPNTVAGTNIDDPVYERLWEFCETNGIAVCFHEGFGVAKIPRVGTERTHDTMQGHLVSHTFEHMTAVMVLITAGVLERYPRLNFAFMESGAGWAPFWLHRMDDHVEQFAKDREPLPLKPSEYFRRQCYLGIEPEDPLLAMLVEHGLADNLLFASDFPHFDAKFPGAVTSLAERGDLSDQVKRKLLCDNAHRFFGTGTGSGPA
ncbi:amidohydrolase family protein [Streptomyces sp. HNM0574]|uniref:amidohydrolase family protein n=1 Tax=Streptomyces sp. HNM0574 TaxID=2714954 RepID=UPI00146B05F6|nr:amidohydrolase family protein [Streptomyces sp. HNM0574]NLU68947.1 amidohydrolase [Streptomyces sp. HNM0574]